MQEGDNGENSDEEEEIELTQWEAIIWLAILTAWVSVLSGYLVDAIQVQLYRFQNFLIISFYRRQKEVVFFFYWGTMKCEQ